MKFSTVNEFYLGLAAIVSSSFFAGMVVTALLARYGVIDLQPIAGF